MEETLGPIICMLSELYFTDKDSSCPVSHDHVCRSCVRGWYCRRFVCRVLSLLVVWLIHIFHGVYCGQVLCACQWSLWMWFWCREGVCDHRFLSNISFYDFIFKVDVYSRLRATLDLEWISLRKKKENFFSIGVFGKPTALAYRKREYFAVIPFSPCIMVWYDAIKENGMWGNCANEKRRSEPSRMIGLCEW